jgi:hypothetical protein
MNTSGTGGVGSTPTAGSGMTNLTGSGIWAYFGSNPSAAIAYQVITVPGTYQATFNQVSSASEDMGTVGIILQGTSLPPTATVAWY